MNKIDKFRGENFFLSNFYGIEVKGIDGRIYPSAEHAFQAAKTLDETERRILQVCPTCAEVKRRGKKVKLRPDWETIKDDVMTQIVRDKFFRNDYLRARLIATGDDYLEGGNNHGDRYWGTVKGEGENHLGKILMKVRGELNAEHHCS